MSHVNATVNEKNKTIQGGSVAHVGQLYFDQDLVDIVETYPPYNTNKQFLTKNAVDFTMYSGTLNNADPVMEYVLLGKDVRDGVFAWINFGIDSKTAKKVNAAAECSAGGCKPSGFFAFISEMASGTATWASFTGALQAMGWPASTATSYAEMLGMPKATPPKATTPKANGRGRRL
jgi:hypothetical protein